MDKARIAVFVSGGGTNLQALIDAQSSGILAHGELVLVVSSSPTAYALVRAEQNQIPGIVISRKAAGSQEEFERQLRVVLEHCSVDLIVLAGFLNILSGAFTAAYPERILNVHPSLIPAFCGKGFYGLKVHQAALDYGVKVTGATVHFVNETPDGGRILLQKAVKIAPDDTAQTLQKRVMQEAEWQLLPAATEMVSKEITETREQG